MTRPSRGARRDGRRLHRRGFADSVDRHADRAATGCTVSELTVLQAVRLKGRVSPTELAATLAEDRYERPSSS